MAVASGRVERVVHHTLDALPSRGPANAPVIVELFFSPTAGPPRSEYRAVEALQARHPTQIRLVYRILRATGTSGLHYAVLEAHAQGKFAALMDVFHGKLGPLTNAQVVELARAVEIDPQRLSAVLINPPEDYDRVLDDNLRRMRRRLRVAAPFVLINGRPPKDGSTLRADLEAEYRAALDRAAELLDRGADPLKLADAFDAQAAPNPLAIAVPHGVADHAAADVSFAPHLATPGLDLSGWPSLGPPDASVIVAVLCNSTSGPCAAALRAARLAQDVFSDSVRLVWAPFFDAAAPDAAALAAISATVRCAESLAGAEDFGGSASRGWRWIEALASAASEASEQPAGVDLDRIADEARIDGTTLAECRKRGTRAVFDWIGRARRAGVRSSPATVIGGRIYPAIVESRPLRQLVEAELFPGDCDGCLHLDAYAPTWRRR